VTIEKLIPEFVSPSSTDKTTSVSFCQSTKKRSESNISDNQDILIILRVCFDGGFRREREGEFTFRF